MTEKLSPARAWLVDPDQIEAGRFPGMRPGTFIVADHDDQGRFRTRFMGNGEFFNWQAGRIDVEIVANESDLRKWGNVQGNVNGK